MKMVFKSVLLAVMLAGAAGFSASAQAGVAHYESEEDGLGGFSASFGRSFATADYKTTFSDTYSFALTSDFDASTSLTSTFLTNKDLLITNFNLIQYDPLTTTVVATYAGINGTTTQDDKWSIKLAGLTSGSYYIQVTGTVLGKAGGSYGGDLSVSAVSAVPEPATYGLLLGGLGLIGFVARRKKQA